MTKKIKIGDQVTFSIGDQKHIRGRITDIWFQGQYGNSYEIRVMGRPVMSLGDWTRELMLKKHEFTTIKK